MGKKRRRQVVLADSLRLSDMAELQRTVGTTLPPSELVPDMGGGDPPSGNILWQESFESGTVGPNTNGGLLGPSNSAPSPSSVQYGITNSLAHGGTKCLYTTITDSVSGTGCRHRLDKQLMDEDPVTYPPDENLPNEAYYSAWYYVPTHITLLDNDAWNIFQWKESDTPSRSLKESIKLWDRGTDYGFTFRTLTDAAGVWGAPGREWSNDTVRVAAGTWFSIEAFRIWSTDIAVGRVIVWVNGTQIFDEFLKTQHDFPHSTPFRRQWTINSYHTGSAGTNHDPNTHTIYMDDVRLATGRQT